MSEETKRIAEKLERLKAADPECRLFGVETHRYRLGPVLSPNGLREIEARYSIVLPEDYAEFLTNAGNGGAGPGYGLQRLGFVQSITEIPTAEPKGPPRVVQKTRNSTLSRRELFDASGKKVDPFDIAFFDSIKALSPDGHSGPLAPKQKFQLAEPIRDKSPTWDEINPSDGTLLLADYGCGMIALLVLNGLFCGQVWLYDPNASWFVPFNETASLHYADLDKVNGIDASTTFRFGSWYEHWIDYSLVKVKEEYRE